MSRNLPIAAISILTGILVWLVLWNPSPELDSAQSHQATDAGYRSLDLATPPAGGDFLLEAATGPVALASLRGQVVLIYFGYTWCPDICPTNLAFLATALRELSPDELARVRVLFVSVDPERDTLHRLAGYAAHFHPNILGVTGTPQQVAQVAKQYGAAYRKTESGNSAMGYLIDHSADTYVVDPAGHLTQTLGHATAPATILTAIRSLLATDGSVAIPKKPGS